MGQYYYATDHRPGHGTVGPGALRALSSFWEIYSHRLDSSTNLGNRDEFSASKNDKGSSMQNTRTLSPLELSYNPQELNG